LQGPYTLSTIVSKSYYPKPTVILLMTFNIYSNILAINWTRLTDFGLTLPSAFVYSFSIYYISGLWFSHVNWMNLKILSKFSKARESVISSPSLSSSATYSVSFISSSRLRFYSSSFMSSSSSSSTFFSCISAKV
jgi:hypothetical protein